MFQSSIFLLVLNFNFSETKREEEDRKEGKMEGKEEWRMAEKEERRGREAETLIQPYCQPYMIQHRMRSLGNHAIVT